MQVILHNGSHHRGVTVLNNQNVLYDGKFCNEFRSIGENEKFSLVGMDKNYRVSCLWYRKVLNKKVLPSYSLPVYPPFAERSEHTHSMEDDKINEEKEYGAKKTPQPEKTAGDKTPTNDKRRSKPKQRYTPPDQSTPKPPKRRSENKTVRNDGSSSASVTSNRYKDPAGISIRKGKDFGPAPKCKYCKQGIPHDRWRVINRVKREGEGYDVKQIHLFHAKLALKDDEFQLLLTLLRSSSDEEIKQKRAAWIQSMHQGMGKSSKTGAKWRSSREWFNDS